MDFYDDVLRELLLAVGAALFVANAYALVRRRRDARAPSSSAKGAGEFRSDTDLAQAPVARSVTYMLIGLVVAIWASVSIITS